MKFRSFFLVLIFLAVVFTGCGKKNNAGTDTTVTPQPTQTASVTPGVTDAVTTASIVDKEEAFLNAISTQGTWIIALLKDLTLNQDLVLEGEFKNGKQDDAGNDVIQRKIALYAQDENRNVTARYTLTAPKITIKSPNASIQRGTFKGDVYVDVDNFELVDATVEGNVVFTKQEYKDSFKMDETSKITGNQTVQ